MTDDDDIVSIFTTPEQYRNYLERLKQAEHHNLHPLQLGLTYGSTWVSFIDLDNFVVEFGRVYTQSDIRVYEEGQGTPPELIDSIVRSAATAQENSNLVFGGSFTRDNLKGDVRFTHRSHCWPCDPRLMAMVADKGFDIRGLDQVGRFLLNVPFRGWRAHVVGR